jgi:hypothetical protein
VEPHRVRLSHRQPWGPSALADLRPSTVAHWTDTWRDPADRLCEIERALREEGGVVRRGGNFDRWDLEVRWSAFGSARVLMAVEEHGGGHQLVRVRAWPACALRGPLLLLLFGGVAAGAAEEGAIGTAVVRAAVAAYFSFRTVAARAAAAAAARRARAAGPASREPTRGELHADAASARSKRCRRRRPAGAPLATLDAPVAGGRAVLSQAAGCDVADCRSGARAATRGEGVPGPGPGGDGP